MIKNEKFYQAAKKLYSSIREFRLFLIDDYFDPESKMSKDDIFDLIDWCSSYTEAFEEAVGLASKDNN